MKYLEIGLKSMLWTIAIGLVVGALFAIAGCAESVPDRCLRYGFAPHSDAFSTCMMTLENR